MPPSPSDSHHPPPYDGADNPLISKPKGSPRPPISFDSREQFQWHLISLSGRCLTTALSLSFLILGLLLFSRIGELSRLEQYGLNAVTILLSAFASLGLGSMLGYLGSMLRWRLLARKKYKMQDIELLLAMPSPSGSAALLYAHFREWRLSLTTFIVMIYLFVNITGRFSVALFGLTYNMLDDPNNIPPLRATNWTSLDCGVLLTKDATNFEVAKEGLRSYLDLAEGGLATLTKRPKIEFNISVPQTLNDDTYEGLAVKNSTLYKVGDGVGLRYNIRDYNGTHLIPSGRNVHTWAGCTMFRLDSGRYWRDYDGSNRSAEDWKDERNGETIAEVLRVLYSKNAWPKQGAEQVTWAASLPVAGKPTIASATYVVYGETAWECNSTLIELEPGASSQKGLFDSASLFLLPIARGVNLGKEFSTSVFTITTRPVVAYLKTYTRTTVSRFTARALVRGENRDDLPRATRAIGVRAQPARVQTTTMVWTATSTSLSTGSRIRTVTQGPIRKGRTASVAFQLFTEPQSRTSPSVGVQTLNFYRNGTALSADQKEYYNRYVATLVARLPIAAIAFGNEICPRLQKDPKARSKEDVKTTLEVNWSRVAVAAGAIVAGQIFAIAVVLYYCRNVYVREDSYLATAELLKTVLTKIDDGSVMTGVELEGALDKILGGPVSYGTISGPQEDHPRVALGREVNYSFPEFPQFRKRSGF